MSLRRIVSRVSMRWDLFMHGFWVGFVWLPCRAQKALGVPNAMSTYEAGRREHDALRRLYDGT